MNASQFVSVNAELLQEFLISVAVKYSLSLPYMTFTGKETRANFVF